MRGIECFRDQIGELCCVYLLRRAGLHMGSVVDQIDEMYLLRD